MLATGMHNNTAPNSSMDLQFCALPYLILELFQGRTRFASK
jgi:hypothetical protein